MSLRAEKRQSLIKGIQQKAEEMGGQKSVRRKGRKTKRFERLRTPDWKELGIERNSPEFRLWQKMSRGQKDDKREQKSCYLHNNRKNKGLLKI